MRTSILPLVLAAPAVVSAAKGTLGLSLGDKNADGSCKATSDYEADFAALKSLVNSTLVRTYSSSECDTAANILPAAQASGAKVVLGMWPDTDASFNQDFSALQSAVPGNEAVVEAITVGSEALYRGDMTADALLARINQVKSAFPQTTVGTADSWNKYADGTADPLIQGNVTYLLSNAFAYWQGSPIDNATNVYFSDMKGATEHIQQVAGSNFDNIRVLNGETGWPTDGGTDYAAAQAGTANAEQFWQDGVCAMLNSGVDVFYFEAFDESWKPDSTGDNGQVSNEQHWGLLTASRTAKFDMTCP
ncbi:1-3-beta-glucanosyltransferase B.t1.c1 [Penicillium riverlandense]|uniref:1-3-beta-glucanosyltransferase B.t1.c1 n=1 Tax=Penicillium riverlandense TaxID=1903569 RepID=UPI002547D22B|nr:1-3-beta-glucanosyltransferase B.t1.c1 [Penicillium riverlandense]KAJ5832332.1 1-3-beta-glucanosyltransferase B.t1.c1 [Penicillium riverlandense]